MVYTGPLPFLKEEGNLALQRPRELIEVLVHRVHIIVSLLREYYVSRNLKRNNIFMFINWFKQRWLPQPDQVSLTYKSTKYKT